jgi:hypothetical protein
LSKWFRDQIEKIVTTLDKTVSDIVIEEMEVFTGAALNEKDNVKFVMYAWNVLQHFIKTDTRHDHPWWRLLNSLVRENKISYKNAH